MKLSKIFDQFPKFHEWAKSKKLTSKELSILTEFQNSSPLQPLIQWIENHKPTHSQGTQILELGGELLLMDKPFHSLLSEKTKASFLIEQLKKQRLMESSVRDENKSKIVNSLPWSSSIQAKWIRQGDRGALSVQFQSFSLKDFKQKIQKMESIYNQLNKKAEKLWKN